MADDKSQEGTAVDLSEEMLAKAREKINTPQVQFLQSDINQDWAFADQCFDLISFSLVLEHIEDLQTVFKKAAGVTASKGFIYVGELHPFKQYMGSKARFDTEAGQQILTCFNHHISDFIVVARDNDFELLDIVEYFDDDDQSGIPRILTLLLRKKTPSSKINLRS